MKIMLMSGGGGAKTEMIFFNSVGIAAWGMVAGGLLTGPLINSLGRRYASCDPIPELQNVTDMADISV